MQLLQQNDKILSTESHEIFIQRILAVLMYHRFICELV